MKASKTIGAATVAAAAALCACSAGSSTVPEASGTTSAALVANARIGVMNAGNWFLDLDADHVWDGGGLGDWRLWFGGGSDIAVAGHWVDGVATDRIGVFNGGTWSLDRNGNGVWDGPGTDIRYSFGSPGDTPVIGSWTSASTVARIGVYNKGTWSLDANGNGVWDGSTGGDYRYTFGGADGDIPVAGDWTGRGATCIGIFNAPTHTWFLDANCNGKWDGTDGDAGANADITASFGSATDIPVVGDWARLGKDSIGVFNGGTWSVDLNGDGVFTPSLDATYTFGSAGDQPVVGWWN